MTRVLIALDTATRHSSVALVDEAGVVRAERASTVTTHSETLLGSMEAVLGEAGLCIGDAAAIACSAGPGSFTGLRIGMATAKGLCFAAQKPLVLVSSLAALAAQVPAPALAVTCLDAAKGELFVAAYRGGVCVIEEQAIKPPALAVFWAEASARGECVLIGDATGRYPELAGVAPWRVATPRAREVGQLAWARLARGEHDDLFTATPRYGRAPEITEKKKR
jgi:tRNA threonylcarbamoyladenosine biosynthesis protein TsaB